MIDEMKNQLMQVSAIENGTVIDHIPASNLFKVISILHLEVIDNPMTFGSNLESEKLGKKAIVKISDKFFADDEINRIALVAPEAKLNIIRNYQVVEKREVKVPCNIVGIVRCVNPTCITNHEAITPRFKVVSEGEISLMCEYCEKITESDQMKFLY